MNYVWKVWYKAFPSWSLLFWYLLQKDDEPFLTHFNYILRREIRKQSRY
jgi:hypothetical protein